MASGAFGLTGPNINPLALLQAKAMPPDAQPGTGSPATPPPEPPSPPVAAPPPAPDGTGPSPGGGGLGAGIGTALSRMMSGDGIFGGGAPGDDVVNPDTGLSPGMSRRDNMQSMMKFGLLMLAAGARQSEDSRARLMAALPNALDNSDNINKFARNRLEMAKLKLLEKQQLNDQAASDAIMKRFATPAPAVPGSPVAAGITPTPAAVADAPPVASGTPVAPVAPPVAPPVPGSPPPAPATAGTGVPAPGGGVPALSTEIPPPPPVPEWQPNEDDRLVLQANRNNPGAMANYIAQQREKMRNMRLETAPYIDPSVGVVVRVYQGGKMIGIEKKGDLPQQIRDTPGPDSTTQRDTVDASGRVTKRDTVRDVLYDDSEKELMKSVEGESQGLRKTYREAVKPAVGNYDKLVALENTVRSGGTLTGKLADVQKQALGWIGTVGSLRKEDIKKMVDSGLVTAELGAAAGRFAKENYGPNVSNQDVVNAQQLLGAVSTGQKEEIAAALERVRHQERNKIMLYNDAADDFNSRLGRTRANKDYFKAERIDKDFAAPLPWEAQPEPAPAQTPDGKPTPVKVKVIDGVRYENDGSGWYKATK